MKIIVSFCIFLSFSKSYNQDLEKHQWQNRVLLILTNDIDSDIFNTQVQSFEDYSKELSERKLIVYKVVPVDYKLINKDNTWINNQIIFNRYKQTNNVFEVILLGLDGGVKLRQSFYLTPEKLFTIIDGMPMRRSEIKSKTY